MRRKKRPPRKGRLRALYWVPPALAGVVLVTALVWTALVDDPDGGRAVTVARIGDNAEVPQTTGSINIDPVNAARTQALSAPGWQIDASASYGDGAAGSPADEAGGEAQGEPQSDFERMQAMLQQMPRQSSLAASGPIDALIEASAYGPVPRIGEDGTLPRQAYARPASLAPDRPNIAIVVSGLGLSQTGTQRAVRDLDPAVTLAFAPTGSSLKRWADKARGDGHELLIQAPMEPFGYPGINPGEHTLLVSAEGGRNADNLAWIMSRIGAYTGVMNYLGTRFASEDEAMRALLAHLGERGLLYLDDGTAEGSKARQIGAAVGTPVVTADRTLDGIHGADEVEKVLNELEILAKRKGSAVVVASAFPTVVEAISSWMPGARARGVNFVPVSAVAEERK
ncbi:divergent polysaccharide deacetylase family protein [Afifella sp. IM 167]|uniref:divergent polysaccharide deacetylase family protein n=1 Tax=Afifella sp. IM 167 TaxID=2033586 RepID=UPI001CCF4446|nr:divergent polysaccharide deacetylase family protein [Afifella sp. IM 167]